jgi:NAD(P)-dependent dehydrogenase (short-subunit alcohol dehydrogenase family)
MGFQDTGVFMAVKYLQGRTTWITGGATGMGRAAALALAAAGADVAIGSLMESARGDVVAGQSVYLLGEAELEKTRREIEACGVRALAVSLDVGSDESVEASFAAIQQAFGRIDILVNAAGATARHFMIDHPDALWHRILNVNLSGPYRATKRCLAGMTERRWGRIVNIASTAANVGALAHAAYCASKSGLLGLTRCVALEGAAHGVTCNAINPGYVPTPQNSIGMMQQMKIDGVSMSLEDYRRHVAETIPQKRWVEAAEIGALIAHLCRDESLGITGEDITVAGGSLW